jgi:hypothetical protein
MRRQSDPLALIVYLLIIIGVSVVAGGAAWIVWGAR